MIRSLLSLTLPKDLGRAVTIDAREEVPSTCSPALHQSQGIQTQAQKGFAPHWLVMINLISGTLLALYANRYLAKR